MKNKSLIITIAIIIIIVLGLGIFFINNNKSKQIKTVSKITLDSKQYINSLKKINIKGTDDYIMITEKVKWNVPDHEKEETLSFSISIPYTIIVDEVEYDGTYELGDYSDYTLDNNPKYNFSVTNLTENGEIEVLITTKE